MRERERKGVSKLVREGGREGGRERERARGGGGGGSTVASGPHNLSPEFSGKGYFIRQRFKSPQS